MSDLQCRTPTPRSATTPLSDSIAQKRVSSGPMEDQIELDLDTSIGITATKRQRDNNGTAHNKRQCTKTEMIAELKESFGKATAARSEGTREQGWITCNSVMTLRKRLPIPRARRPASLRYHRLDVCLPTYHGLLLAPQSKCTRKIDLHTQNSSARGRLLGTGIVGPQLGLRRYTLLPGSFYFEPIMR